jgi:hypothetical protein
VVRVRCIAAVGLLAVCAAAPGCAPGVGSADLAAASFDERLLARCVAVLSDEPMPAAMASRRAAEPGELEVAARRTRPPAGRKPAAVRLAAAEEFAVEPTPEPEPEPPRPAPQAPVCGDACSAAPCGCGGVPCPILGGCGQCAACLARLRGRLVAGPGSGPRRVGYHPELPPKFLPVPTQPVMSPARPDAPDPWRGDLEFSWRPRITVPGDD